MRTELGKLNQVRKKFRAVFEREGKKANWHGYSEPTVLLRNVVDESGKTVTDHIWFTKTKTFDALGILRKGDVIEFEARVTDYVKGYVTNGYSIGKRMKDYKLSRPTKVRRCQ